MVWFFLRMTVWRLKMFKILSLCDYSGSWSKPYRDAGYDVIQVDLQHGNRDVRLLQHEDDVHGILAAPPCTCFASSGAWVMRTKNARSKTPPGFARAFFEVNP